MGGNIPFFEKQNCATYPPGIGNFPTRDRKGLSILPSTIKKKDNPRWGRGVVRPSVPPLSILKRAYDLLRTLAFLATFARGTLGIMTFVPLTAIGNSVGVVALITLLFLSALCAGGSFCWPKGFREGGRPSRERARGTFPRPHSIR